MPGRGSAPPTVLETPCRVYRGPRSTVGDYAIPYIDGEQVYLHRWVSEQIDGPLPPGICVLHRCDNPPCFRYDHLFRGTKADNNADAAAKGRMHGPGLRGETHGRARLTWEDVRAIRASSEPFSELAVRYRVGKTTIAHIRAGRTWKED